MNSKIAGRYRPGIALSSRGPKPRTSQNSLYPSEVLACFCLKVGEPLLLISPRVDQILVNPPQSKPEKRSR